MGCEHELREARVSCDWRLDRMLIVGVGVVKMKRPAAAARGGDDGKKWRALGGNGYLRFETVCGRECRIGVTPCYFSKCCLKYVIEYVITPPSTFTSQ